MVLTAGELKKRIENMPDDMPVYYQRIEDVYFEKHGWEKESKKLVFDCYGDQDPKDCMDDYVPAFSAYKHPDDDVFVINAHY